MFILQLRTDPYQTKIFRLFTHIQLVNISKAALCKARKKLSADLFHELAEYLEMVFYRDFATERWHGFRVLAVDGSTLNLPKDRKGLTVKEYGVQSCGNVLVRVSALYDPLNKIFLEAFMDDYQLSEQEMAKEHVHKVQENDLVLFDRNYASRLLMAMLLAKKAGFLFRMKSDWKVVKEFMKKKHNTQTVSIELTKAEQEEFPELPSVFEVRLVKRKLGTGEVIVFATSLLDRGKYSNSAIFDLYWKRWQIEESYKFMKKRIKLENWTGLLPVCHEQDFGAAIVLANLSACLAKAVELPEKPKKEPKRKKPPKQRKAVQNMRQVLETGKDILVEMMRKIPCKTKIYSYIEHLRNLYEWIDPGRQNPRKLKKTEAKSNTAYG